MVTSKEKLRFYPADEMVNPLTLWKWNAAYNKAKQALEKYVVIWQQHPEHFFKSKK